MTSFAVLKASLQNEVDDAYQEITNYEKLEKEIIK
jgi:hypothetical protein